MIIKHLSLKNFRKYINLEIDLPNGVIGVIGKNGCGKSTFLEGIAWILYGSIGLKTKIEQIYPDFVDDPGITSGVLRLEINRVEYQLNREYKLPNKSTATLYMNDLTLATGTREVTEEIIKISGMDYKAFQTSFYTRQNELNLLGSLQAAERSRRLEEMLGLQKTNIIINNIKGDLKELAGMQKEIEHTISREEQFKADLENYQKDQDELAKSLNSTEQTHTELSAKEEAQRILFNQLDSKREQHHKLSAQLELGQQKRDTNIKRIGVLQENIEEVEKSAERYQYLRDRVKKLPEIQTRFDQLSRIQAGYQNKINKASQLEQLNAEMEEQARRGRELSGQESSFRQILSEIGIINNNIKDSEIKLNSQKELRHELRLARNRDFGDLEKLKTQIGRIEEMGPEAECSFCHRPFEGDMQSILDHFSAEIAKLEQAVGEHDSKISQADGQVVQAERTRAEFITRKASLEKEYQALSPKMGELESLRKLYKSNREKQAGLEAEFKELADIQFDPIECEHVQQELSLLHQENSEYQRLTERMSTLEKEKSEFRELTENNAIINNNIKELQAEIAVLEFSAEIYQTARQELERITGQVKTHEKMLNEARQNRAVISARIEGVREKLQLVSEARQRSQEMINDKIYLETLIEVVKELKTELASRIRPALIRYSSELLDSMSDGKFNEINLDENYEIFIRDYGEFRELKRFSGGEQDLANLSLRLAISKYIAQNSRLESGFLILDEVFGSQDSYRKENILNAIANLQDFFQQIFMVTHVDEVKESVTTLFTVEENPDGSSRINIE